MIIGGSPSEVLRAVIESTWPRFWAMLDAGHLAIHALDDPTPEDETVFVTLTERELLVIGAALPVLELVFYDTGCFGPESKALQAKLVEVTKTQRPHWTNEDADELSDDSDEYPPTTEGRSV